MSSYYAGRAQFNAILPATTAMLTEGTSQPIRSSDLTRLARCVSADATLRQLESAWVVISQAVPTLETALPVLAAEPYQEAVSLTGRARAVAARDPAAANRMAARAAHELRSALTAGAVELCGRERQTIVDVTVRAARQLGYSVQTSSGRRTTAVEARRNHEVVVIAVMDGGTVEIDHAGVPGDSCLDWQESLAAEMSRLGVDLRGMRAVPHGQRRGGTLITAAARQGDFQLARAVVRQKENGEGA